MAVVSELSPAKTVSTPPPSVDLEKIESILVDTAIRTIQEMVEESQTRLQKYKTDPTFFSRGTYYPKDYASALGNLPVKDPLLEKRLINWLNEGTFVDGYMAPDYFDKMANPKKLTGFESTFILRKGKSPSEALEATRNGLNLLDCTKVCIIAYLIALKTLLGDQKFDVLFAADSLTPLTISNRLSPYEHLLQLRIGDKEPKRGSIFLFLNYEKYLCKHIDGAGAAYTVICIDDSKAAPKYTTLGLDSRGVTPKQILMQMLEDYNSNPSNLDTLGENLKKKKIALTPDQEKQETASLKEHTLKEEEILTLEERFCHHSRQFRSDRIAILQKATLEQARKLVDFWALQVKRI
jgi:hypothetical protein